LTQLSDQVIVWSPQEGPQTALVACPIFEVFFGGARGGGKTDGSLGDWLQHSAQYGEAAVGVFFRRKFKQLSEVIARSKQLFKPLGAKYNEQKAEWLMPGGARLLFRYLERDSDAEEYQGHNYTRLYIEEVTNFPSPAPINKLRATLRSASGVPVGMRLTGNPGGPGHNWVKARYIDPNPRGFEVIEESTELEIDGKVQVVSLARVFIPSKLGDNKLLVLNDPTYILRLRQAGSEALVQAWLEGNWNVVDGTFFDEWGSANVLSLDWLELIPKKALHFASFDWGSAKPFSVGWWALSDGTWGLPDGALVRYDEWYGAKSPNVGLKLDCKSVAAGIIEKEKAAGRRMSYRVADPAIFIRNGGPSIAEQMLEKACTFRPADNKRVPGAAAMRSRIVGELDATGRPTGRPMLYVLETCEDFLRTVPVLQHDEKDPEDVDTEQEDHAYDDARYAVMSRPWAAKPKEAVRPSSMFASIGLPQVPGAPTFNDLVARLTRRRKANEFADS
jgi:Terminase large subunit, T4likevirus-type, N-terminal